MPSRRSGRSPLMADLGWVQLRAGHFEQASTSLLALLDRSERLYERVRHLDRRMYVEDTTIEVPNPVLSQFDRLQAAFGR